MDQYPDTIVRRDAASPSADEPLGSVELNDRLSGSVGRLPLVTLVIGFYFPNNSK